MKAAHRFQAILLSLALLVAFVVWNISPIQPHFVLFSFAFVLFAIFSLSRVQKKRLLFYLSWWAVFAVAVMGTATVHDLTVRSYASALCCDGTYSYSANRSGTCSWHHGVCVWRPKLAPWWKRF